MKPAEQYHLLQHNSRGFAGVLFTSIVAAAMVLFASQNTVRFNMRAYHSPNKSNIEVSNQLTMAGLRYVRHVISNDASVQHYIDQHRNNPAAVLVCNSVTPLPGILQPVQEIHRLPTPAGEQEIAIKAVFAPYDCNLPISQDNYRATFETTGGVGCNSGDVQRSDNCVTRSVVQSAYEGNIYRPIIETAPVTYTCPLNTVFYMPAPGSEDEQGIIAACAAVGVNYPGDFHLVEGPVDTPVQDISDFRQTGGETTTGGTGTTDRRQNVGN
jgi:hypothetical protein